MKVRELIELLQKCDPEIEVVYTYDSIYGHPYSVDEIDQWDWLPDPTDKVGKSYQPTGKKIVVIE